ncbi:MAG: hypothetical protein ABIN94_17515 [Ferruginibacter sp.]
MVDLFRYIELSFVAPSTSANAIDVSDETDFQDTLRSDLQQKRSSEEMDKLAENYIARNPVEDETSVKIRQQYLDLHRRLLALTSDDTYVIEKIIEDIFDTSSYNLLNSEAFRKNKRLLNDLIIAVKMVTGFDKVRVHDLVAMRQAIAFIESTPERNDESHSSNDIKNILLRPIVVPAAFLKTRQPVPPIPAPISETEEEKKRKALEKEYDHLKTAYSTLLALRPDQLHITEPATLQTTTGTVAASQLSEAKSKRFITATSARVLTVKDEVVRKLDPSVLTILQDESVDLKTTAYSQLAKIVADKARIIGLLLDPCSRRKEVTKIYRLGINAFAVKPTTTTFSTDALKVPDFSKAITKPLGIGNLQVVRQELLGYEAKEISHIENVLEGEVLRHSTNRIDISEVTITDETQTTQSEERDLQSTVRNEMVSETQKEAGQSTSAQDQTTSSSYGKLVENSKSNFAKSVTDRAVSSLTQQVRHQRIQREKKTFKEKSVHEFDNSKTGAKNITGIYQWVDKKLKTRIMNYGLRMLYDVVVPEPAAFLIESLKNAPQPEGLELVKPDIFDMCPTCIDTFNYGCLAAKYGVTGAVTPPPDDFLFTKQHVDFAVEGPKQTQGLGNTNVNGFYFKAYTINIPENYKAVHGYIQMVTPLLYDVIDVHLEFNIGENHHFILEYPVLYVPFQMASETGEIPVTFRSHGGIYQYSYAIAITCLRTDKAYEQWQLKTHAAIQGGYNRQLAEYQDKLSKFQAMVRAQMAQAANYAHNPSIEQAELKKAFIYLLLGEHFGHAFVPSPNPLLTPPDPVYIKKWGAMVAFFERAFEWENIMFTYYPYFWGQTARWGELILIQDISPQFEEFLKAGAARVVVPIRPGFEASLAHYHETGDIWMGEEMPDIFSPLYVSIIQEIKARNFAPGDEICVAEWDVNLPTTLVMLKDDATLPAWVSTVKCNPPA